MFKCKACKRSSKPGMQPTKIVLETRNKNYFDYSEQQEEIGFGYEIVKEENWCKDCVDKKAHAFLKEKV